MGKSEPSDEQDGWRPSRRELLLKGFGAVTAGLAGLLNAEDAVARGKKRRKTAAKTKGKKGRGKKSKQKPSRATHTPAGPIPGSALYSDLITYYNLGEHRTATEADLRTSDWLARQLKAAGLKTELQPFRLKQFFTGSCSLEIEGKKLRAFPLWPPRATGPIAVRGRVVSFEAGIRARGAIAVVKFPFDERAAITPYHVDRISEAAKAGAAAVIAVTAGPTGEIIALNTRPAVEQWPVPVALIAPRDEAALEAAAFSRIQASLLIDGREESAAVAKNVVGRLDRGKHIFVVSTPQSGWFRCGGERGPGIALFLGLARWARRSSSEASFLFVSTSGHELGGLGVEKFIKDLAPRPERVICWLHLGAGIATYEWEDTDRGPRRLHDIDSRRRLMCRKDLVELLSEPFAGLAGLTPNPAVSAGEYEQISRAGYRAFAIVGASTFHHTPADSPEMTGPEILEPVGTALVKSIEAIEAKYAIAPIR